MEKLEYPKNVKYVMDKYGEYLEGAFQVQQISDLKRRTSSKSSYWYYIEEMNNVRDKFTTEMMGVASKQNLNVLLTKIIAQNYVTKNRCFGNEVERVLTDIKRDLGLGMFCFDALSLRDEVYKSYYKEKIILEVMRQLNGRKRKKLVGEKGIGEQEVKEDLEVLGDVIDLIIDGAVPIKIGEIEDDIEQNKITGKLKDHKLQSKEAEMIKSKEDTYLRMETQALIDRFSEQEPENLKRSNRDKPVSKEPIDFRVYSGGFEITDKISEGVSKKSEEQKKGRAIHLEVNMQQITHLIDFYVDFLLNDDLFFIKNVIGVNEEKKSKTEDETEFKVNAQGLKGSEAFDLVNFISYYSPKEYESIKKYVLSQINRCKKDEVDLLKKLINEESTKKSCTYAIQRLEELVDKNTKPNKFERMKKYLMVYYSYQEDSVFEKLSNGISFQKAIAYEFTLRFLSTKTPEQLLELVKSLEAYEKSFETSKPDSVLR